MKKILTQKQQDRRLVKAMRIYDSEMKKENKRHEKALRKIMKDYDCNK